VFLVRSPNPAFDSQSPRSDFSLSLSAHRQQLGCFALVFGFQTQVARFLFLLRIKALQVYLRDSLLDLLVVDLLAPICAYILISAFLTLFGGPITFYSYVVLIKLEERRVGFVFEHRPSSAEEF
jgi:hypothetical protein